MTYVMSDIHGMYEKYIAMLEKINFSDNDSLFVLGDIVDRGENPVKILQDMMKRPNVWPLFGNHDFCAYTVLRKFCTDITEENYDTQIGADDLNLLSDWHHDGGDRTIKAFYNLSKEDRKIVLDYFSEFSMYEILDIGEKTYILVHAGLGNFSEKKSFDDYTVGELLCCRTSPDQEYFDDKSVFVVMGHTPTLMINGEEKIIKSKNNIFIDCGAVFGGKLACLCLETMEEYYV